MPDDDRSTTDETDDDSVSGAKPSDTDIGTDDTDSDSTGGDDADPAVVAAEEKLRAPRRESADRRRELKPWKDLSREFGLTPEQIRERLSGKAAETAEVDADTIRREAVRDATAKADKVIVRAEATRLAADLFADPHDAPLFVDLSKYEVDDDGAVDEAEITDDLRAVLERKPHLAKATEQKPREPRTPRRDPSQGSGRTPAPVGAEKGLAEAARRFGTQNVST